MACDLLFATSMTHPHRAFLLPFLVSMAACVPQVVVDQNDPGDGGGGSGGSGSGVSTAVGGSGGGPQAAVAMTRAQLDVLWDEYWANQTGSTGVSTGSGGGDDLDPNDLFVLISDLGASCQSPTTELSCGGHWSVSLAIPPVLQQVGVYDLEDPLLQLYSYMSETGQPYSPDPQDCSFGGGSLGSGTLEILSITPDAIHIRLTADSFFDADPSGEYSASRCP
jgi:hypothetical protein